MLPPGTLTRRVGEPGERARARRASRRSHSIAGLRRGAAGVEQLAVLDEQQRVDDQRRDRRRSRDRCARDSAPGEHGLAAMVEQREAGLGASPVDREDAALDQLARWRSDRRACCVDRDSRARRARSTSAAAGRCSRGGRRRGRRREADARARARPSAKVELPGKPAEQLRLQPGGTYSPRLCQTPRLRVLPGQRLQPPARRQRAMSSHSVRNSARSIGPLRAWPFRSRFYHDPARFARGACRLQECDMVTRYGLAPNRWRSVALGLQGR